MEQNVRKLLRERAALIELLAKQLEGTETLQSMNGVVNARLAARVMFDALGSLRLAIIESEFDRRFTERDLPSASHPEKQPRFKQVQKFSLEALATKKKP